MESWFQYLLTIISTAVASSGLWAFIIKITENKAAKKRSETSSLESVTSLLVGLGHDRIVYLGMKYLERGYITREEYNSLCYIYNPYKTFDENGDAKKIMSEVENLKIKEYSAEDRQSLFGIKSKEKE